MGPDTATIETASGADSVLEEQGEKGEINKLENGKH